MTQPRQDDPQFKLRVPRDLLMSIAEAASANNRSTNAEIVARLEASGKTLRDEFAMAAMSGLLSDATVTRDDDETIGQFYASVCSSAYEVADAMLAARQKGGA